MTAVIVLLVIMSDCCNIIASYMSDAVVVIMSDCCNIIASYYEWLL